MQLHRSTTQLATVGIVGLISIGLVAPAAAQRRSAETHLFTMPSGGDSRIGVTIEDVADNDAADEGAMVNDVRPESPAESAGITAGDVIVEFDGERVRSARQLTRLVQETPAGRTVGAAVLREGARVELEVTPAPASPGFAAVPALRRFPDLAGRVGPGVDRDFTFDFSPVRARPRLGASVQELSSQLADYFGVDGGVLVTEVDEDSVAAAAGLQAGDVITAVDDRSIDDVPMLRRRLSAVDAGEDLVLDVTRGGRELELTATLESEPRSHDLEFFGRRQGI